MTTTALGLLRHSLAASGNDVAIVTHLPHIRRISGFSGSNAVLIVSITESVLFTDGRYAEQVVREVTDLTNIDTEIVTGPAMLAAANHSLSVGAESIAVQGQHLSAIQLSTISSARDGRPVDVLPEWLEPIFGTKEPSELESIRRAQFITDTVFSEIVEWIHEGVSEMEVAAELTYRHLKKGASKMSFDPIVAFGANSALPHARPGKTKLYPGVPILLDFGCVVEGYCSDMTRMMHLGEPSAEFAAVYDIVGRAKQAGLAFVRAGVVCKELDDAARSVIISAGYGDYFSHSLGHGVGLEIHEWPSVSKASNSLLPSGAVITIEPGIYLPGKFGVRIEDMVIVTDSGCENLTTTSSDLVVL